MVRAIFRVQGLVNGIGFKATLILPVARLATLGSQFPMGGPERWFNAALLGTGAAHPSTTVVGYCGDGWLGEGSTRLHE
jgi:hypothetical protein